MFANRSVMSIAVLTATALACVCGGLTPSTTVVESDEPTLSASATPVVETAAPLSQPTWLMKIH